MAAQTPSSTEPFKLMVTVHEAAALWVVLDLVTKLDDAQRPNKVYEDRLRGVIEGELTKRGFVYDEHGWSGRK